MPTSPSVAVPSTLMESSSDSEWKSYVWLFVVLAVPIICIVSMTAVKIQEINRNTLLAEEARFFSFFAHFAESKLPGMQRWIWANLRVFLVDLCINIGIQITEAVRLASQLADAAAALAVERGMSCLYIDTSLELERASVLVRNSELRLKSERALELIDASYFPVRKAARCLKLLRDLKWHREQVDSKTVTCAQNIEYYTDRIRCFEEDSYALIRSGDFDELLTSQMGDRLQILAQNYAADEFLLWLRNVDRRTDSHIDRGLMKAYIVASSVHDEMQLLSEWQSVRLQRTFSTQQLQVFAQVTSLRSIVLYSQDQPLPKRTDQLNLALVQCCPIIDQSQQLRRSLADLATDDAEHEVLSMAVTFGVVSLAVVVAVGVCIAFSAFYAAITLLAQDRVRRSLNVISLKNEEIHDAKKAADQLLYGMLPEHVTKYLKAGQPVPPGQFECASVCFIQIRGFDQLSRNSTPMQLVHMLNDVYSYMDHIIQQYDCYKVETVSDQYMVASGLPTTNGEEHSFEICKMMLHMVRNVRNIVVPHNAAIHVAISAGANTGSIVTAAVGHRQPRYCLFGDTINVASRLNSTSKASHIQISSEMHTHLLEHKKEVFKIVPRGTVSIKGKGSMNTFWLMDEKIDIRDLN